MRTGISIHLFYLHEEPKGALDARGEQGPYTAAVLKNSHASALVVAALLALATLLILPAVLVAKTASPLAEAVPSKMTDSEAAETTNYETEETTNSSSGVDEAPDAPSLQQLALEKLTLEEETTPAPEPVPEKTTSKKQASKKRASNKVVSLLDVGKIHGIVVHCQRVVGPKHGETEAVGFGGHLLPQRGVPPLPQSR